MTQHQNDQPGERNGSRHEIRGRRHSGLGHRTRESVLPQPRMGLDATPSGVVQFAFNQTEATNTGSVQVPIDLGRPFHQVNDARRIHPEEKTTCPFPPTKRFSN